MTAADLERLDVPLAELIRRVDSITAGKRATSAAGVAAENRHLCDPQDTAFADLACTHPDQCTTATADPGWTAWLNQQIALSNATRRTR